MQMGKTPVAVGSSVPVCPQRFALKRPFTRRTTSKLVGPLGLSTTTTPQSSCVILQCFLDLVRDPRAHLRLVSLDAATRCVVMTAAAELLGDRGDVHPAARAEADPPGTLILRLAEAGRDLDAVHAAGEVDETVGQISLAAGLGHHSVGVGVGGDHAVHLCRGAKFNVLDELLVNA